MWWFVWDTTPSKVFIWTQQYSKIFVGDTKVRPSSWPTPVYPTESIVIKLRADTSWQVYIPTCWYGGSGSQYQSYDWQVSIDGWQWVPCSWTWNRTSYLAFWWYTHWEDYVAIIKPTTETYGWARAYGWINNGSYYTWEEQKKLLREVIYDGSYMWYASSATNTWDYFRYYQYSGCTSITSTPTEYIPNTVTTIWQSFRAWQFSSCTWLTTISPESIGTWVTTIGNYFRVSQYYGCTSLTSWADESLPEWVTSLGYQFRFQQYYGCTSLATTGEEALPSTLTYMGDYFRQNQYFSCPLTLIKWMKDGSVWCSYYRYGYSNTSGPLTVKMLSDVWPSTSSLSVVFPYSSVVEVQVPNQYLQHFKDTSVLPRSNISDSLFVWY